MRADTLLNTLEINRRDFKDLHIIRLFSSFVVISEGRIIKITDPVMTYCPLARHLYRDFGIPEVPDISAVKRIIKQGIEEKISRFGFFSENREILRKSIAIPYGASEIIMYALKKKIIDAAVVVCDGAGSVITDSPEIVQGIGARMNGLFYTTPIQGLINRLEEMNCHVPFKDASIDQIGATEKAAKLGYKNIAVTVNSSMDEPLNAFGKIEKEFGASITTFMVCSTGVEETRVNEMAEHGDVVWSCASTKVREIIGRRAILQITRKIPVFVLTRNGLNTVSGYCSDVETIRALDTNRQYFIAGDCRGKMITMGTFQTYLSEVKLPVRSDDEPIITSPNKTSVHCL